jgi:hypothetical protein
VGRFQHIISGDKKAELLPLLGHIPTYVIFKSLLMSDLSYVLSLFLAKAIICVFTLCSVIVLSMHIAFLSISKYFVGRTVPSTATVIRLTNGWNWGRDIVPTPISPAPYWRFFKFFHKRGGPMKVNITCSSVNFIQF